MLASLNLVTVPKRPLLVRFESIRGKQILYVLVFLCLHSREVIFTSLTKHLNSAWVKADRGTHSPEIERRILQS